MSAVAGQERDASSTKQDLIIVPRRLGDALEREGRSDDLLRASANAARTRERADPAAMVREGGNVRDRRQVWPIKSRRRAAYTRLQRVACNALHRARVCADGIVNAAIPRASRPQTRRLGLLQTL